MLLNRRGAGHPVAPFRDGINRNANRGTLGVGTYAKRMRSPAYLKRGKDVEATEACLEKFSDEA